MDFLSDFSCRINQSVERKKLTATVRKSRLIVEILHCLYSEGYISGFFVGKTEITIHLKYYQGKSVLGKLQMISKRSKRVYMKNKKFFSLKGNFILLTDQGVLISKSFSLNEWCQSLGGEVLFFIH